MAGSDGLATGGGTAAPSAPRADSPHSPAGTLTLSYQQRMLSWPHMQVLEEQSSVHTQYCGDSGAAREATVTRALPSPPPTQLSLAFTGHTLSESDGQGRRGGISRQLL